MTAEVTEIEGTEGELTTGRLQNAQTDWIASPSGNAYSIEVMVTETSDVKKWIKALSDELERYGNSG
jgi:hypothetical protein